MKFQGYFSCFALDWLIGLDWRPFLSTFSVELSFLMLSHVAMQLSHIVDAASFEPRPSLCSKPTPNPTASFIDTQPNQTRSTSFEALLHSTSPGSPLASVQEANPTVSN